MTTGLGQNCVTRGRGPLEIPFCKPQIGAKTETWLENSWRRSDNIVGDLEENYDFCTHEGRGAKYELKYEAWVHVPGHVVGKEFDERASRRRKVRRTYCQQQHAPREPRSDDGRAASRLTARLVLACSELIRVRLPHLGSCLWGYGSGRPGADWPLVWGARSAPLIYETPA